MTVETTNAPIRVPSADRWAEQHPPCFDDGQGKDAEDGCNNSSSSAICFSLPVGVYGCDVEVADRRTSKPTTDAELDARLGAAGDCMHVRVHDCHAITRVPPSVARFRFLETLCLTHCTIDDVSDAAFPASLRCLTISYSGLRVFEPRCLNVGGLAELDLSFNRLTSVPKLVGEMAVGVRLDLKGNDLWYAAYSDLPASRVLAGVGHELMVAYHLGIIPTSRANSAVAMLRAKRLDRDADELERFVALELKQRAEVLRSGTYANAQNAHLVSVQTSTERSIARIREMTFAAFDGSAVGLRMTTEAAVRMTVDAAVREAVFVMGFDAELGRKIVGLASSDAAHPQLKITFGELLARVYAIARDHEDTYEMIGVLRQEVEAGICTCLTGALSRMVGALCGFVDGIQVTISSTEELTNRVLAVRRSYAARHRDDVEAYVAEVVPAVWQMLEDFCVPEPEHPAWLAYL